MMESHLDKPAKEAPQEQTVEIVDVDVDQADQLIVVEKLNALDVFYNKGGLEPVLSEIRRRVEKNYFPAVDTEKARKAITSLAYKIRRTKVALDNVGKALIDESKQKIKTIDFSRQIATTELGNLIDKINVPLEDWKRKEADKLEALRLEKEREIAKKRQEARKEEEQRRLALEQGEKELKKKEEELKKRENVIQEEKLRAATAVQSKLGLITAERAAQQEESAAIRQKRIDETKKSKSNGLYKEWREEFSKPTNRDDPDLRDQAEKTIPEQNISPITNVLVSLEAIQKRIIKSFIEHGYDEASSKEVTELIVAGKIRHVRVVPFVKHQS